MAITSCNYTFTTSLGKLFIVDTPLYWQAAKQYCSDLNSTLLPNNESIISVVSPLLINCYPTNNHGIKTPGDAIITRSDKNWWVGKEDSAGGAETKDCKDMYFKKDGKLYSSLCGDYGNPFICMKSNEELTTTSTTTSDAGWEQGAHTVITTLAIILALSAFLNIFFIVKRIMKKINSKRSDSSKSHEAEESTRVTITNEVYQPFNAQTPNSNATNPIPSPIIVPIYDTIQNSSTSTSISQENENNKVQLNKTEVYATVSKKNEMK